MPPRRLLVCPFLEPFLVLVSLILLWVQLLLNLVIPLIEMFSPKSTIWLILNVYPLTVQKICLHFCAPNMRPIALSETFMDVSRSQKYLHRLHRQIKHSIPKTLEDALLSLSVCMYTWYILPDRYWPRVGDEEERFAKSFWCEERGVGLISERSNGCLRGQAPTLSPSLGGLTAYTRFLSFGGAPH